MAEKTSNLESILDSILSSKTIAEEVAVAIKLNAYFEGVISEIASINTLKDSTETKIDGGVALSSQHALDCLKDPLRTIRFIKGTYQAITDVTLKFPDEKIELLYAGCGPVAPIIITLLSGFSYHKLGITLLDINQSSIDSIKLVIDKLELNAFISEIALADATQYKFPEEKKLHIILSETMDKGLTVEPQVRITQNLAPQLIEGGILIPEKIEVYTEYSFLANEVVFDGIDSDFDIQTRFKTRNQQLLLCIDKNIMAHPAYRFLSNQITAPTSFKDHPDICVFAKIIVYKNQIIKKGQSYISNPICVSNLYHTKSPLYQLEYDTKGIPNWKIST